MTENNEKKTEPITIVLFEEEGNSQQKFATMLLVSWLNKNTQLSVDVSEIKKVTVLIEI